MMKKSLLVLLASLMAVSATVQATMHTDKTYMNVRPVLNDLATEVSTWHASKALHDDNMFGGTVQVAGFYVQSDDRVDAGKYFGTTNSYAATTNTIENFISVENDPLVYTSEPTGGSNSGHSALFSADIAHFDPGLAGSVTLSPRRTVGGARLDYHQKLNSLLEGLWFKADLAVVSAEHKLDMKDTGTGSKTNGGVGAVGTSGKTVIDVLSGSYSAPAGSAAHQAALTKAKLVASRSAAGVADINLQLGYDIFREEKYHFGLNLGLVIPTGNKPSGEFLFEPTYGTRHFALGAGFDGCWRFHQDGDFSARIMAIGDYRYQFKAEEIRTAGFVKSGSTRTQEFSHYYALGSIGAGASVGAIPAANVLTRAMNVTPASQFEGLLGLGLEWDNIVFDAGYNLFYRDEETVAFKTAWTDSTYGTYTSPLTRNADLAFTASDGRALQVADITLAPCTTPQLVSHKVYGGLGYIFRGMETPVHLGLGGSYEFKGDNAALTNWSISAKLGVAF